MHRLCLCLLFLVAAAPGPELITNGNFSRQNGRTPTGFQLSGDVAYRYLGDSEREMSGMGVALTSAEDLNGDGAISGAVAQAVEVDPKTGRWYRFSFRALAQDGFVVADDDLHVKIEFLSVDGKQSFDHLGKKIYPQIEQARKDLGVNGVHKRGGAETWRTYEIPFRVPFMEVGQVKVSVGFSKGQGVTSGRAWLYVTDFSLVRIGEPVENIRVAGEPGHRSEGAENGGRARRLHEDSTMIALGGRWFYQARDGERAAPREFDYTNADRLWYHDATWSTPFAGNMSAVLKAGYKDLNGNIAEQDTPLPRNVIVSFDRTTMTIRSSGIPNHPTGKFPETWGRRGNPSYISMQDSTYRIPLEPKENPQRRVIDDENRNGALNMGPIGIAVNGVVFFNPFDMGNVDATDMMDRCCGHPQREGQYHYHKYPICVNSPWDDQGTGHSGLLGWALDGYPLYGPYETSGVMAKDVTGSNALNDFNMHYDEARGWHYHVTPGKFPYLIGGYWGEVDRSNMRRPPRGPRP